VIQVAVLTVSDRSARGDRPDASGPVIAQFVRDVLKWTVAQTAVVPDDAAAICSALTEWCDDAQANLIFTTGGTGFAPRDVTPEATRAIIDREAPGLAACHVVARGVRYSRPHLDRQPARLAQSLPRKPGDDRAGAAARDAVARGRPGGRGRALIFER